MKRSESPATVPADNADVRPPAFGSGAIRIVGFDPGLNVTGYGVIEVHNGRTQLVEAGTVRSKGEAIEDRLLTIHRGVREILTTFRPASMALEQLFVHSRFPKTAILMGHARGIICLAAAEAGLAVHHYLPNRVKSMLTGSGHAGKEQMQMAVQRELQLRSRPEPADAADALAIALADYHLRLRPQPGRRVRFRENT
ncbi:MAG: crossover junction endodeoxyribonuclease RuvC [Planctomycetia bacterium]|jgi:crossover junction endodeoxyribonuclease RuvC|nr:crossover junction endodeoxyribonuclease RuvC [Planctomycetia bacterium]